MDANIPLQPRGGRANNRRFLLIAVFVLIAVAATQILRSDSNVEEPTETNLESADEALVTEVEAALDELEEIPEDSLEVGLARVGLRTAIEKATAANKPQVTRKVHEILRDRIGLDWHVRLYGPPGDTHH